MALNPKKQTSLRQERTISLALGSMEVNTHNAPNSSVEETAGLAVAVLSLPPEKQERKSGHMAVFAIRNPDHRSGEKPGVRKDKIWQGNWLRANPIYHPTIPPGSVSLGLTSLPCLRLRPHLTLQRLSQAPLPASSCNVDTWLRGKSFLSHMKHVFRCTSPPSFSSSLGGMKCQAGWRESFYMTLRFPCCVMTWNKAWWRLKSRAKHLRKFSLPRSSSPAYHVSGGGFWNSQEIPLWGASSSCSYYCLSVAEVAHTLC